MRRRSFPLKLVTLSIPGPFSDGPQYTEDGDLISGSWPAGLPHEDIRSFVKLGTPSGGRELVDIVVNDDWPIGDIPSGWLANGSHKWDLVTKPTYDEDGELLDDGLVTEVATDYTEYSAHFDDPATTRQHVILGWPEILT